MKKLPYFLFISLLSLAVTGKAYSASIGLPDNTNPVDVYTITNYNTTGTAMAGMKVSVLLSNGSTETSYWNPTSGSGTSNWSLTLDSYTKDTYTDGTAIGALWSLANLNDTGVGIQKITINAVLGETVFDTINFPALTPNSKFGWPIDWTSHSGSASNTNFIATYSNPIKVIGDPSPYFDLYGTLTIDFGTNYFQKTDTLNFYTDTDNTATPEPISLVLFGIGIIGLGGRSFKRKTSV